MRVAVYADLSCKKSHRQVSIVRILTSESLGGVTVSMLTQNSRDMDSIPVLGIACMYVIILSIKWPFKRIAMSGG